MLGKNEKEMKFHVSAKNGKNSLRFETMDTSGLEDEDVNGLIGKFLKPGAYSISDEGLITVHGTQIVESKGFDYNINN